MGCASTKVNHEKSAAYMKGLRQNSPVGFQSLILGIKDQNYTGKVYICGPGAKDDALLSSIGEALLKSSSKAVFAENSKHDHMWDVAWHNTKMTSGLQVVAMTKPYFPRGKIVVGLLDALSEHGWVPMDGPNFGGPINNDDDSVDWPSIAFGKPQGYTKDTLLMAIKDQNVPGKLCVAGPPDEVAKLKGPLLENLQTSCGPNVSCEFDSYDTEQDWDAVFSKTSLTSGAALLSFGQPYFPKGKRVLGFVEEAYKLGWRLVASPNFGGLGVSWPCFIFRKLINPPSTPPELLMAAIKDQNIPGKVCFAGAGAQGAAQAVHQALKEKTAKCSATIQKDEYDDDFDQVIRSTNMTTGMLTLGCRYFPKSSSMSAMLNAMNELGYNMAAAPNFGGNSATWPTFIWEKRGEPVKSAFVAIKDQNWPGKVCIGGVGQNEPLKQALLRGFWGLTVKEVSHGIDDWDSDFDMAFRNTAMTTGRACFTLQSSWFPLGFPIETLITEMGRHGYRLVGGPNFGASKMNWPCMVFELTAAAVVPAQAVIFVEPA